MEEVCDLLRMVQTRTIEEKEAGMTDYHKLQRVNCPQSLTAYEFSQIVAWTENGNTNAVTIENNDWSHPVLHRLHNERGAVAFTETETGELTLHF